jgi:hypothetical protein
MRVTPPQPLGATLLAAILLIAARPATAQDVEAAPPPPPQAATRSEVATLAREARSEQLTPYQPGRLERALIWIENDRVLERLLNPAEGFYPKLGTVTPGGGFALGPAYRRPELFGGPVAFSAFAMGSLKKYWLLDAKLTFGDPVEGRVFGDLHGQRSDFPSEDFFGLGPASDRRDHVKYGLHNRVLGVGGGVHATPWLTVTARVDHLSPDVSAGESGPSIERLFDATDAPGLDVQPDFFRYEIVAEANYREPRGNPRKGGRYALTLQQYDDRDTGRYDFQRIEADLQQYISLYKERRVLALHALVSVSDAQEGGDVPFYFQRTLGGPDDLRGFRRFRFRDRNLLLLQAEYRWEIFTAVDGAIFYDTGKVASRWGDLRLEDLESNYGIGFRFGTSNGIFLRIEGAFGSAGGSHYVFRFGHVF